MFIDLCLGLHDEALELDRRVAMAGKLGYHCIAAHDIILNHAQLTRLGADNSRVSSTDSLQEALSSTTLFRKARSRDGKTLRLSRGTLCTKDVALASTLLTSGPLRRKYDVVAVQPLSAAVLEEACQKLDVDIIFFDLSQTLPFKLVIKDLTAAIKRGVHFELGYSSLLQGDSDTRTIFIAASQMVCKALRGRNVIISSHARNALELRGPHDIINCAALLGLKEADAKAAISRRCMAVLEHALAAKTSRSAYHNQPFSPGLSGLECKRQKTEATEDEHASSPRGSADDASGTSKSELAGSGS